MKKVNPNKLGLVLGGTLGVYHLSWAMLVWVGAAKVFMDFIFKLHFINFQLTLYPFSWGLALMLVVVASVLGYLIGLVAGVLWNWLHKKS